jgi:hypothetical protein
MLRLSPVFYTNKDQVPKEIVALFEREAKFSPDIKTKAAWHNNRLFSSLMLKRDFRRKAFLDQYGFDPSVLFEESTTPLYLSWHHRIFLFPNETSADPNVVNWILLGIQKEDIVGFVSGKMDSKLRMASLNYVETNPRFRGKGYCKPLVILTLQELRKQFPSVNKFVIENASAETEAACYCYLKAAEALKLQIKDSDGVPQSSSKTCAVTPEGTFYFFI